MVAAASLILPVEKRKDLFDGRKMARLTTPGITKQKPSKLRASASLAVVVE